MAGEAAVTYFKVLSRFWSSMTEEIIQTHSENNRCPYIDPIWLLPEYKSGCNPASRFFKEETKSLLINLVTD
jgi:hypothetical protein